MNNNLKMHRNKRGLTQGELAKQLSVTRQTINSIENNKYNPTLELALNLGRFFEVPVEELFIAMEE
ncbi:helix-turn-helix transcriptional regulator [Clostridium sp. DL1XJH146]